MNERHDIETVINRIAVAEFLVPSITLILRCAQNGDGESRRLLLEPETV